jgi:hypothetical protein
MAPVLSAGCMPVGELLNSANFVLVVPPYQRNYQWAQSHVCRLLEDIEGLAGPSSKNAPGIHLLGNVVLLETRSIGKEPPEGRQWYNTEVHECEVIDNQQRCTTLVILYAAIHAKLREKAVAQQDAGKKELLDKQAGAIEEKLKMGPDGCDGCMFVGKDEETFNRMFSFLPIDEASGKSCLQKESDDGNWSER